MRMTLTIEAADWCRRWPLPVLLLGLATALPAQVLLRGSGPLGEVRLHTSDLAIFAAEQQRDDIRCAVSPHHAMLGFDLRFHAGYEVAVPLRELAGRHNLLSILFRVTPVDGPEDADPVYFVQRIRVPEISEDAQGDAYLHGSFELGVGDYKVSWLMRDRSGRVCSDFWDVQARLTGKDRDINLTIAGSEVRPAELEQFREEPPVIRADLSECLSVKVLVNFAPQNQHAATLQPMDTSALVSILRTISREPRIGKFSVVAFNLHEQRVIYRQENADRIDFPALGKSLDTLELGTVDLERLSNKHGETAFLTELLTKELARRPAPDALIFAGPKAMLSRRVSAEDLQSIGPLSYPIYYMNYNLNPYEMPWRDTIGNAVKALNGREYTITRPRDLWRAVTEMVTQIAKDKDSRAAAPATSE